MFKTTAVARREGSGKTVFMVAASEMELFASEQCANAGDSAPLTSPETLLSAHPGYAGENWLVTGGAGFLGSNFILSARAERSARIFNLDKLAETGNMASLDSLHDDQDHVFIRGDIRNRILVERLLHEYMPSAVIHFAVESPSDHSFLSPDAFVQTNVLGTFSVLEEVRLYWESMEGEKRKRFRFLHVSSPEVYGPLGPEDPPRSETAPYQPAGVFAASKAACDHLVRAYHRTSGLPVLIANSTCCYGPFQFPYAPIPRIILNALEGKEIPLLGGEGACRDWIAVEDCCHALRTILDRGRPGETYHISNGTDVSDRDIIRMIGEILDSLRPDSSHRPHGSRTVAYGTQSAMYPRYSLDGERIRRELGWMPRETLLSGLNRTVRWYLENTWWIDAVRSGEYHDWSGRHHVERQTGAD